MRMIMFVIYGVVSGNIIIVARKLGRGSSSRSRRVLVFIWRDNIMSKVVLDCWVRACWQRLECTKKKKKS